MWLDCWKRRKIGGPVETDPLPEIGLSIVKGRDYEDTLPSWGRTNRVNSKPIVADCDESLVAQALGVHL